METRDGNYLDIKQKSRPFKKPHSHTSISRGMVMHYLKNTDSPIQKNKNQTQRTSVSRGGSKDKRYASTKGYSIKTNTKTYEQR